MKPKILKGEILATVGEIRLFAKMLGRESEDKQVVLASNSDGDLQCWLVNYDKPKLSHEKTGNQDK